MMETEGVFGEDYIEITDRAIAAIREWQPHYLHVVLYVGDSSGHWYGPEADETLWAIGQMDEMTGRILNAYADANMDGELVVLVNADHGMVQITEMVPLAVAEKAGALPHGRVALAPKAFDGATFDALMNDPRVDDIFGREELELLGAYGPRWGEQVLNMREGAMFETSRGLIGYHGAWTETDRHIPMIWSGAGIREGAELNVCELIDVAPTMSALMGGAAPENNEGRVLWEALDTRDAAPNTQPYLDLLESRGDALERLKELKRERAGGAMYLSDYEAQRAQILAQAKQGMGELAAQRQQLVGLASG
jgi:arylsulfatase A-like enzyme